MIVWLVTNTGENAAYLPYKEQYRLFYDFQAAIEHMSSMGYIDPWGFGINADMLVGQQHSFAQGDVSIALMKLEIK